MKTLLYYDLLSSNDQQLYNDLKSKFSREEYRHNRNKSLDVFLELLQDIRDFCTRSNSDDWKRYLVCGICWIDNENMVVNVTQLKFLLSKSKTTINSLLQSFGFETEQLENTARSQFLKMIPSLATKPALIKQWTLRKKAKGTLCCNSKSNKSKYPCGCTVNGNCTCCYLHDILSKGGCCETHECKCVFPDDYFEYGNNACSCLQPEWRSEFIDLS